MITCRELIDYLADYIDGDLPASEVAAFEEHLSVCPECVNYVESYRHLIKLGRNVLVDHAEEEVPPSVPTDLVRAIVAARNPDEKDQR